MVNDGAKHASRVGFGLGAAPLQFPSTYRHHGGSTHNLLFVY